MSHQGMKFDELVSQVKPELKNAKYSDLCIRSFVQVWDRLANYMVSKGEIVFTAKTGMNFLEAEYGITVYKKLTQRNRRYARAVNLLTDYLLHRMIFPKIKQG